MRWLPDLLALLGLGLLGVGLWWLAPWLSLTILGALLLLAGCWATWRRG
jgi:hypothetical protein